MAFSTALSIQVPAFQYQSYAHLANPIIAPNSYTDSFYHPAPMATPDPAPEDPRKIASAISRSKEFPWYEVSVGDKLTPGIRNLLVEYSGIAPNQVEAHVYKVRDIAWEVFPWPCIGEWWFLYLGLSTHPSYPSLLTRFKDTPTTKLLDLGTCLGQDLRKLVFDGAPVSQLYGADMLPEYEAVGYDLFQDKEKFAGRFIASDIFATDEDLAKTEGTWDVISIFMFLHVWDMKDQKRACQRLLKLLKPKANSWIIGAQTGSEVPFEFALRPPFATPGQKKTVYRHNLDTFRKMWEEVAEEEGVRVDIWLQYEESPKKKPEGGGQPYLAGEHNRRFFFLIKRK